MHKERDESLHEISSTGESSQWGQDDSSTNEAMDYFETFSTSFQGNVYIGKSNLKMQAQWSNSEWAPKWTDLLFVIRFV